MTGFSTLSTRDPALLEGEFQTILAPVLTRFCTC